jgi:hypothetical protein
MLDNNSDTLWLTIKHLEDKILLQSNPSTGEYRTKLDIESGWKIENFSGENAKHRAWDMYHKLLRSNYSK